MSLAYFDAAAWCTQFNTEEDHHEDLVAFMESCQHDDVQMVCNEIMYLEARTIAVSIDIPLIDEEPFELLSIVVNSEDLLKQAGSRILPVDRHRNHHKLKALDKLHLRRPFRYAPMYSSVTTGNSARRAPRSAPFGSSVPARDPARAAEDLARATRRGAGRRTNAASHGPRSSVPVGFSSCQR